MESRRPPGTLTLVDLHTDQASIPQNPLLAESLYLTGFIEKLGSGTQKILALCKSSCLPEPSFEQRSGSFVLTLWRDWLTGAHLARLGLNERQLAALDLLRNEGQITSALHQARTGASPQTAARDLDELVKLGVLERRGQRRGTFYVRAKGRPQE